MMFSAVDAKSVVAAARGRGQQEAERRRGERRAAYGG